jgi:hypothetical protein
MISQGIGAGVTYLGAQKAFAKEGGLMGMALDNMVKGE